MAAGHADVDTNVSELQGIRMTEDAHECETMVGHKNDAEAKGSVQMSGRAYE